MAFPDLCSCPSPILPSRTSLGASSSLSTPFTFHTGSTPPMNSLRQD